MVENGDHGYTPHRAIGHDTSLPTSAGSSYQAAASAYREVVSHCWQIYGTATWRGWVSRGQPLEDSLAEELYLRLRRLRPFVGSAHPLYKGLVSILDDHLRVGLEYDRAEFLAFCTRYPVRDQIRGVGDHLEAMDQLLSEAEKSPQPIGQPGTADPPPDAAPPQYVSLSQMAAIVNRSKRSLEKTRKDRLEPLPEPVIRGSGGKPSEWRWDEVRGWLEKKYGRRMPDRFPLDRFRDGRADRS